MAERQSARMSKITNDGLTRSGTGCFIAVPIWQQWVNPLYRIESHHVPTFNEQHVVIIDAALW